MPMVGVVNRNSGSGGENIFCSTKVYLMNHRMSFALNVQFVF